MSDRLSDIEARVRRLEAEMAALHRNALPPRPPAPLGEALLGGVGMPDVGSAVPLVGRTLFVLAGAFLLRALTDSGRLNAGPGVVMGLAFAATWIVTANRAGLRGRHASAAFHGLAFVLIAFPLLFEATTRFHFLTPVAAAAGLTACTAIALVIGWRWHLQGLAWVTSIGGLAMAGALAIATAEVGPFAIFLIVLGVATLWLGYVAGWTLLRWPVAACANFAVLVLSLRAGAPGAADTPAMAFGAQIALLVTYLGSFAARTLVLNRAVIPFEVAQSIAAALVGLGGAARLTHVAGISGGELAVGIATFALAAGSYGAAAIFVERGQRRRRNDYFYTTAGLIFALAGGGLSMSAAAVGWLYTVFGVVAAWTGRVSDRGTYRAHGAVYLTAAVVATGLVPYVLYGLGLPLAPSGQVTIPMLGVLVLSGVAMWGLGFRGSEVEPPRARRVPRLMVLVLVLGGVLGTIASVVAKPGNPYAAAPAIIATVRTALLVATILALALAARFWAVAEGGWLVYPLLLLTGLKFLLEDVRAGRPATLFASFALYGLALIVAPRLYQKPRGAPP
jgi:hypothetical protein